VSKENPCCWRDLFIRTFGDTESYEGKRVSGESFDDLIANTLTLEDLDRKFDTSYGHVQGKAFVAWSEKYVYFPVKYDGAESVGFIPRNPCDEITGHWGGG